MNINKRNYEEFALDFLEGNLSSEVRDEFQKFLDHNPEIKEEIQSLEIVPLRPDNLGEVPVFNRKEELYKEAAVVSLLKRPIQFKLWQIAAAVILLLSSVWVLNSYYTHSGEVIQIVMEESDRFPGGDVLPETEKDRATSTTAGEDLVAVEKEKFSTPGKIDKKEIQDTPTQRKEMADVDAEKDKVITDLEMSEEEAIVQGYVTEEWINLNPREIASELREKEDEPQPVVSNLLPSKMTKLDSFSGGHDRVFESHNSQNSLEKKDLKTNRVESLFARLVDRVIPSTYSGGAVDMDIALHKDRIPVALLPEIIQQQ